MLEPKPFKTYEELADLLESRGMLIEDRERTVRKLAQIGYYRFTGYSYHFREYELDACGNIVRHSKRPVRKESFFPGTSFNKVFELYLLDKKLRLALFDAIERIEVYARSIIAHEMGRESELAYQDERFIDRKFIDGGEQGKGGRWKRWQERHQKLLDESRLDCICWHRNSGRAIPIWVAVEAWDFGLLSNYFSMLKGRYKHAVTRRIGIALISSQLESWLNVINIIRNKCAHHSRLWNINIGNEIPFPNSSPFDGIDWSNAKGKSRMFGVMNAVWYLVKQIGSHSTWIETVAEIVDRLPDLHSCTKQTMGFPSASLPAMQQFLRMQ